VQDEATMLRTAGGKVGGAGRGGSRPRSGVDGGGPAAWRGARASADFGRPATAKNPVGG
jgi:hypothetical protein